MQDSLIPKIQQAINDCAATLEKMESERDVVMDVLRKARYINCDTLHLIENQYSEKIGNTCEEILSMTEHLRKLKNQSGKDDN
jgi:hypothetical protein